METSTADQYTDVLRITSTIELPPPRTFRTDDNSLTCEFWYRWVTNPGNSVFGWVTLCLNIANGASCSGFSVIRTDNGNPKLRLRFGGRSYDRDPPNNNDLEDNDWHYIAASGRDNYNNIA